jgi:hypothetical protein
MFYINKLPVSSEKTPQMRKKHKLNYYHTILTTLASLALIFLFYTFSNSLSKNKPNVFLNFQYTSKHYYKIMINDSLIIDSKGIRNLKYNNKHYKIRRINLDLKKGCYKIQIKEANDRILDEAVLIINTLKPKYIYFRKKIIIRDTPFILI